MPNVSVVIPTYNCANYISEAIDSVLAQTYTDYEIIVIDDGSTDNTHVLLTKYGKKIKYIYQQNKGPSSARNLGIKKALGEYVALLDADDVWLDDKLENQIKAINGHDDVALIFTDIESFNKAGIVRKSLLRSEEKHQKSYFKKIVRQMKFNDGSLLKDHLYADLLLENFIPTQTVLLRKNRLAITGYFDERFNISEDYDLWLRILKNFPVLYLNKITTRYRVTNDGLSGDLSERWIRYRESDAKMLEKHMCISEKIYIPLIKKRISDCYGIAASENLKNFNRRRTITLSFKALSIKFFQLKPYVYIFFALFFPHLRHRVKIKG